MSCEDVPELPEDVWLHILGSVSQADIVSLYGLLNTSTFHRKTFVKHVFKTSGLDTTSDAFEVCCRSSPNAPGDIWTKLIQARWGLQMFSGEFIPSVEHAIRLASSRQIYRHWSALEQWWDAFLNGGHDSLPILRRLARVSEQHLTPGYHRIGWYKYSKENHTTFSYFLGREIWAEQQHLIQNEAHNVPDFPVEECVEVVRRILKLFPMLPTTFLIAEDALGRPQFRWFCDFRSYKVWQELRSSDPVELRLSFKSVSFVRVSIETLYGCTQDHYHDSCQNYPGFPMYLDLSLQSGLNALYDVICFFIRCVEPMHDNVYLHGTYLERFIASTSSAQASFDRLLEKTCEDILLELKIPRNSHYENVIDKLQDETERSSPSSVCKTNYVALLRAMRREINALALNLNESELLDWPRRDIHAHLARFSAQFELHGKCIRQSRDKVESKPRSVRCGYPRLWPPQFFSYAESMLPILAERLKMRLNGCRVDPIRTESGFVVPKDDSHRNRFSRSISSFLSGKPTGCPSSLFELLADGFQYLEQGACERFRRYRERPPLYEDTVVPPEVLLCYFSNSCTKHLGRISQVIWYCDSLQQNLCHSCAFRQHASGETLLVDHWSSRGQVQLHVLEFECGEAGGKVPEFVWQPPPTEDEEGEEDAEVEEQAEDVPAESMMNESSIVVSASESNQVTNESHSDAS